jgi:trans-aconitate 2-methyltransferase
VRLQVYAHLLEDRSAVVDWLRGSLLTGYVSRLSASLADGFVSRYRELLLPRLEDTRPFLNPLKRIRMHGLVPARA